MVVFEFKGRNKEEHKCMVEVYGKTCSLKQLRILISVINSLYDSTNFYTSYKDMYDRYSCMVTLENDRYLLRFLVPSHVSPTEIKKTILLFSLRDITPLEMVIFLLENSADILIKTPRSTFKIAPPDGGDLVIE